MKFREDYFKVGDQEFFDYGTGEVQGKDFFATTKTGMSYYDNFLDDPEYMKNKKNMVGKIVFMTPQEYFKECAKLFNSTYEKQVRQTAADTNTINYLKSVLQVAKKKFPLPFINYATKGQEGRHRMYVAAMLTSKDTKFPVLVIDYFDKDKAEKNKKRNEFNDKLESLKNEIQDFLEYEVFDDVQHMERKLRNHIENSSNFGKDFMWRISCAEKGNDIVISIDTSDFDKNSPSEEIKVPKNIIDWNDDPEYSVWLDDILDI